MFLDYGQSYYMFFVSLTLKFLSAKFLKCGARSVGRALEWCLQDYFPILLVVSEVTLRYHRYKVRVTRVE